MAFLGMKEDDAIEDRLVSRQIEKAQRKVEAHNFDIRKNLLDFDDVNNDQRKVIYEQRNELLEVEDVKDTVASIRADVFTEVTQQHVPANSIDAQWDIEGLEKVLAADFGLQVDLKKLVEEREELTAEDIARHVVEAADALFAEKEAQVGGELMRALEKHVMLTVLDGSWKEHLARMDYLRQGIHLRGYAQKQPKQEYKREAFELFSEMLEKVKREVTTMLARVRIRSDDEIERLEAEERRRAELEAKRMQFQHESAGGYGADEEAAQVQQAQAAAPVRADPKVGRNDPCPCGSGKKYKHCHGQLA
jgi:preprotein translocase subunit SecA